MENGKQDDGIPSKKLFAFWSADNVKAFSFFALIHSSTESTHAQALAAAALGEANEEEEANNSHGKFGCNDGLCIEKSVERRLQPLGFEFVKVAASVIAWEDFTSSKTLFEVRLAADGVHFSVTETNPHKKIVIPTDKGNITADLSKHEWEGPPTHHGHGVIERTEGWFNTEPGYDYLLQYIRKVGQPLFSE